MIERKRIKIKEPPKKNYAGETRGPKSSYRPEYAKLAGELAARGATDADLALAFGKTTWTIRSWCATYPEFGEAVAHGKNEIFDPKVERALAERALGYTVDMEEIKVIDGAVVRVPTRKHFPPDTTACIFWLKNRKPEQWRDVWKIDHAGELKLDSLTAEQLLAEIRKEAAELGILPESMKSFATGVAPNGKGNGKVSTKH